MSTKPRLRSPRVPKRTEFKKINTLLEDWPFSSLGSFLQTLFYNHRRGELDPRTKRHERVVTRFLQGKDKLKMVDIIQLIYHHCQSRPKPKYPAERAAVFSARIPFGTLKHAAPALSAWATQLVKARAHFVVDASFVTLRDSVAEMAERGEAVWGKILDNCQQYSPVWEHGIGRAFNADDHIVCILQEERQNMTTDGLLDSIDWDHVNGVMHLHYVRILVEFVPVLQPLSKEITALFRNKYAIHRIPDRGMTELQPLGMNSEHSTETQGMSRAHIDFDQRMGIEPEKSKNILDWIRGDGASFTTLKRLQKYELTTLDIYKSCRNVITTPETWHTKATELNACASNHYGPAVSKDLSALSRSSHTTNMKRPTDLKKCDFYPPSRSMTLIWEAQLLDSHFNELNSCDALPTLDDLIEHAQVIRVRYASQTAYELSLSNTESQKAPSTFKVPFGELWARDHTNGDEENVDSPPQPCTGDEVPVAASNKGPKTHVEPEDFDGDHVLSNSIIFLQEFGWWIELCYAIPEGDIGRVLEIFKNLIYLTLQIFIFTFAGSANLNYTRYLLDLHVLLTYECSPDLKEAMLNNWFMFLSEDIRIAIEGNITQEWSNKWMEGMLSK
ncbi:hypothetical protein B0H14DRAFT_3479507 [Mycena olivaceomarginata]|nr:hypothetical protein B0H14DRAFT_3479507 [Mycena olivaceomarginata]